MLCCAHFRPRTHSLFFLKGFSTSTRRRLSFSSHPPSSQTTLKTKSLAICFLHSSATPTIDEPFLVRNEQKKKKNLSMENLLPLCKIEDL